jgi:F-box-like
MFLFDLISFLKTEITTNQYYKKQQIIAQDAINVVPRELLLEIFSQVNLTTLGAIYLVSKRWKQLASDPLLWKGIIYRDKAFGSEKWIQHFGKGIIKNEDSEEAFSSLPEDIGEILRSPCPAFPKKRIIQTHMLVWIPKIINGVPLTLKSLGELTKQYFNQKYCYISGYRFIENAVIHELGDKPIGKHAWVLMTNSVLPGSRNKSYANQQNLVADLAKKTLVLYEVPDALKASVCIFAEYFNSGTRLFSSNPWTYTSCQEEILNRRVVVGGFIREGLFVDIRHFEGGDAWGVAALRMLKSPISQNRPKK